ncbi:hypothetical protein T08_14033 [Trichinella sp. T8]|nr:hypothetical protein T08_14033 [Trichinella sp. T8]
MSTKLFKNTDRKFFSCTIIDKVKCFSVALLQVNFVAYKIKNF